jgi:hypothetical protein
VSAFVAPHGHQIAPATTAEIGGNGDSLASRDWSWARQDLTPRSVSPNPREKEKRVADEGLRDKVVVVVAIKVDGICRKDCCRVRYD